MSLVRTEWKLNFLVLSPGMWRLEIWCPLLHLELAINHHNKLIAHGRFLPQAYPLACDFCLLHAQHWSWVKRAWGVRVGNWY